MLFMIQRQVCYGHRLECDMATNIKREEAANAPKARAAALQTDLNKLENIKVRPASPPQPLLFPMQQCCPCGDLSICCIRGNVGSANNANPTCVSYNN